MKVNYDWCASCKNRYGSVPCINYYDRKTYYDHLILYHSPSNYQGEDKDKKFIETRAINHDKIYSARTVLMRS